MRWLIILGCLAVAAVGVMIGLVLFDEGPPSRPIVDETGDTAGDSGPAHRTEPSPARTIRRNRLEPRSRGTETAAGPVDEDNVHRFGQEFERKWYEDRSKLGAERHLEMEKLWFEGRRPRGDPGSIGILERLLREFPDTNRAGCAAMELGHHYIRRRDQDLDARRKKARELWHQVEQRYGDVLCEYNAPAGGLSKLALATWVYRHTDPGMARRLLEEIIARHQGETDHLGRPLEQTARRLLKRLE